MKTVDKVEHNHPDLILQLPEEPTAFIEFNVCRDDSVVERAKFKEDKCRLGEEAQTTPRRPSYLGRDEGRDSESDGSFAGEDMQVSRLQKAAVRGSVKALWKTLKSSG